VNDDQLHRIVASRYRKYLNLLKALVAIPTVYDNASGLDNGIRFCQEHFMRCLPHYHTYVDAEGNLISYNPDAVDAQQATVYLSAHIDTVPADDQQWHSPFQPFSPFENEEEIVGRGMNDCKAGVAYQLWLASQAAERFLIASNLVFTITRREEQGGTSARAIARAMGRELPAGPAVYALVLENTMDVRNGELGMFHGERSSLGIRLVADPLAIRRFFLQDPNPWNPTSVFPIDRHGLIDPEVFTQAGGHAATTPREQNVLYQLLVADDAVTHCFLAGDSRAVSSIPAAVTRFASRQPRSHELICDLRTLKDVEQVERELQTHKIPYEFIKQSAFGYEIEDRLRASDLQRKVTALNDGGARIVTGSSSGLTDAGLLYNAAEETVRRNLITVTCGPGCRSQRDVSPPRLTHGVNETYDKRSGFKAITWISQLLADLGTLTPYSPLSTRTSSKGEAPNNGAA
jgi:acetylornithine deacetylase/succinyl-diaminopimelate desuccinylase-like protein